MTTISTNTNIIKIKYHSIPSFIVPPHPTPHNNKQKNKKTTQSHNYTVYSPYNLINFTRERCRVLG